MLIVFLLSLKSIEIISNFFQVLLLKFLEKTNFHPVDLGCFDYWLGLLGWQGLNLFKLIISVFRKSKSRSGGWTFHISRGIFTN